MPTTNPTDANPVLHHRHGHDERVLAHHRLGVGPLHEALPGPEDPAVRIRDIRLGRRIHRRIRRLRLSTSLFLAGRLLLRLPLLDAGLLPSRFVSRLFLQAPLARLQPLKPAPTVAQRFPIGAVNPSASRRSSPQRVVYGIYKRLNIEVRCTRPPR